MGAVENTVIILLVLYALIVTYLLYDQYHNQDMYMQDRVNYINKKTLELDNRERNISRSEVCERELTRLRTIHRSALDVLNSYTAMQVQ